MAGQIDLAKLLLTIETDLNSVSSDLRRAQSTVSKSSRTMDRDLKTVERQSKRTSAAFGKMATRFAAFVSVGAAVRLGQSLISVADALDKTASRLGVNVEQLQVYQQVAALAGVQQEKFNLGLQRFLRRVAEARTGQGELRKTIEQTGLRLNDANGRVREGFEVFQDYLDIIRNTEDGQRRLQLAFKGFDSEGVALVNVAKLGREEIARLGEEFRRTGTIVEEETIRSLVRAQDAITRLAQGIQSQLVTALGNAILGFESLLDPQGVSPSASIEQIEFAAIRAETKVGELQIQLEKLNQQQTFSSRIAQVNAASRIRQLEEEIAAEQERARILRERLEKRKSQDTAPGPPPLPPAVETDEIKKTREELDKLSQARIDALAEQEAREIEFLERQRDRAALATDDKRERLELEREIAMREASREVEDLIRLEEVKLEIEKEFAERKRQLEEELREEREREEKEALDEQMDRIRQLSDEFSSAFQNIVFNGDNAFERLGESFLRKFIDRASDAFFESVLSQVFGAFGGTAGGPFGAVLGSLFGSGAAAKKAATGADVGGAGRRTFIVGDGGEPEVLRLGPGQSGRIDPLSTAGRGGGGNVSVQVVTTEAPQNVQVRRLTNGADRVMEIIVGEAARSVARPGAALDRTLRGSLSAGRRLER